jgi:eukaryotic-like serine/threonine-protein kinase
LSEQQLSALFGGHERVFRMRSGGAHELWRRTGGNASLVARELDGWVQAHMARWHSDKLVLEPDALPRLRAGLQVIEPQRERPQDTIEERLQAWLYLTQPEADPSFMSNLLDISSAEVSAHIDMLATRGDIQRDESGAVFVHKAAWMEQALPEAMRIDAHRSIATALPQGHPRRLYHLVAAGEQTSVVDEQLAQALRWDEQGMVQRALLTLDDSIKAARAQRTRLDETPLLLAASRIALASGSKRDLERLLYALDATPHPTHLVQTCTCLVSIALQIIQGASLKGLEALEELIVIFEDDELELRRCQWRWRACQALPMEVAETTIKDIGQWAESTQDENIEGTYLGWLGTLRYRQQRFEEAARLHIRAASLKHRPTARISSWLNATVAFESALLLEDAWHTCEQARRQAILCEHRDYELYASAFARQLAYRRDEPLEPDPELLEVMRVSGALANMASIIVVETMILWRSGDREGARRLASEGLNVYANLGLRSVTIVACLIAALDERVTITERLWEEVRQLEMPRLLVQCAGILATRQTPPDDILELVRQRADAVPPEHWHTRLEMNSFAQAFDQLGLATPDHVARSLAAQRT